MDYDLRGRPIEEKKDGSLFTADGEFIGIKQKIEKPGYDKSAIHKEEQARNSRKAIANLSDNFEQDELKGFLDRTQHYREKTQKDLEDLHGVPEVPETAEKQGKKRLNRIEKEIKKISKI